MNITRETRGRKLDFNNLGQSMALSDLQCHSCKNMVTVQKEHICKAEIQSIYIYKYIYIYIYSPIRNYDIWSN